ncbi:MAG: LCP family protein, partial [Actinomycetota bacterium]
MRRAALVLISLALVSCSAAAAPDTPTPTPSTTASTSTTSSSVTTLPSTTTTIPYRLDLEGADPALARLVTALYAGDADPDSVPAPRAVTTAIADSPHEPPDSGTATMAAWDDETRLAVVEAGEDVTLAVADPEWRIVGGWWPEMGVGPRLGGYPKIVAVVGSDARPGENREAARTDSIHFVGMDRKGNAAVVGVPRDSWVPIPGAGNSKINAALAFGGPDMMMDTFVELTGLDFDGYLLTGFAGFQELVDLLGGLAMDVPRDFNDRAAKAYLDAGEQVLDAAEALALARTRKTLPRGDFQRQEHGGLVLMAAQAMLRADGPHALPRLLAGAREHASTDMGPEELLLLSAAVIRVDPDRTVGRLVYDLGDGQWDIPA